MKTKPESIVEKFKEFLRRPYAWPGGYEMCAITTDGGVLCYECCRKEFRNILHSTKYQYRDGWSVAAIDIVWEGECFCDQCSKNVAVYTEE